MVTTILDRYLEINLVVAAVIDQLKWVLKLFVLVKMSDYSKYSLMVIG